MPPEARLRWLKSLTPDELDALSRDWSFWARDDQLPPPDDDPWTTWLILGGRGAGKTRAGAEWVDGLARAGRVRRVALVGETYGDVREVMIEGASGIRAIAKPGFAPAYQPARRRLEWPNGVVAEAFSAEDPDGLRGPQFGAAWSDELCKWRYAEAAWSNLQLALRLGERPRQAVTTTPRPTALLKRLMERETTRISRASTYANKANLAPTFLAQIVSEYEGSRLGRQELMGEIVEDAEGALWTWAMVEAARISKAPDLERVVVAVDPPAGAGPGADECGIVVAGRADIEGAPTAFILADRSEGGLSPAGWGAKALAAFADFEAGRIIVEANQGGEMARSVFTQIDPDAPVKLVRASRGKTARAEPVAALYERGRVRHVGAFPRLEDQMTRFDGSARSVGGSPDRLDALVWAVSELLLAPRAKPNVRRF